MQQRRQMLSNARRQSQKHRIREQIIGNIITTQRPQYDELRNLYV